MIVELFSLVANVSTLSGISLRDVVKIGSDRERLKTIALRTAALRRFLTSLEEPGDPLVGYWKLDYWHIPPESVSVPGRLVSGGLAIYFRERDQKCWHGTMCLSYHTRLGWWHKRKIRAGEPPFIAIYDVRFSAKDLDYTGTSHMIEKVYYQPLHRLRARLFPGPTYEYSGTFSHCRVEGKDSTKIFLGVFENNASGGEHGKCSFRFHVPLRWGMIENNLLSV